MWFGCIIQESVENPSFFLKFPIYYQKIVDTTELKSNENFWHLLYFKLEDQDFLTIEEKLFTDLKNGPWYSHFWNQSNIKIIFKEKSFKISLNKDASWEEPIKYGISLGIPENQLDFDIKSELSP